MDVPPMTTELVSSRYDAERIAEPGANRSTHAPKLEYAGLPSPFQVAATVRASGVLEGEYPHASAPLFPAATATTTPALIADCTAEFSVELLLPPSERFATAGTIRFLATQSRPAMTPLVEPLPVQSS